MALERDRKPVLIDVLEEQVDMLERELRCSAAEHRYLRLADKRAGDRMGD